MLGFFWGGGGRDLLRKNEELDCASPLLTVEDPLAVFRICLAQETL